MKSEAEYTALNAIGVKCNTELKQMDKKDLHGMKAIIDRFAKTAELIGFTAMDLKVQIGRINGQLVDRRLEGY